MCASRRLADSVPAYQRQRWGTAHCSMLNTAARDVPGLEWLTRAVKDSGGSSGHPIAFIARQLFCFELGCLQLQG